MKVTIYSVLVAVACFIGLQSCDDDDNLKVPHDIQSAFQQKYPGATRIEWETKPGYYVADFYDNASEASAWFTPAGVWCMTETDVFYSGLPEAVKAAFEKGDYKDWRIDDVDKVERRDLETVYILEVEKRPQEMDLYYSAEGILIKALSDMNEDDDYQSLLPTQTPEAILSFINDKYPGARLVEMEMEQGVTEVEIIHDGRYKEVRFADVSNWISTSWDVRPNELPVEVTQALANSEYSTYTMDDADYYETPQGDYYLLEMEKGNKEVKVKINTTGVFV